jgi:adenylate kinase family enzyme
MNLNKIAIIGISGSGKSTLSRKLGEKTGLPVFHMDPIFWRGKWEEVPEAEYLVKHQELLKHDKWIIEGWIDRKMSDRLKQADLIIDLDYSGLRCALRLIKRWWKHRKESRPELPQESLEEFMPKYWWRVLRRKERKNLDEALEFTDKAKVVKVHNPKELQRALTKIFQ